MFCAAIAMLAPVILVNVAGVALVAAVLVLRGTPRWIGKRQR